MQVGRESELYRRAVQALAKGDLPDFSQEREVAVVRAFMALPWHQPAALAAALARIVHEACVGCAVGSVARVCVM
jgi:hypothetical protein